MYTIICWIVFSTVPSPVFITVSVRRNTPLNTVTSHYPYPCGQFVPFTLRSAPHSWPRNSKRASDSTNPSRRRNFSNPTRAHSILSYIHAYIYRPFGCLTASSSQRRRPKMFSLETCWTLINNTRNYVRVRAGLMFEIPGNWTSWTGLRRVSLLLQQQYLPWRNTHGERVSRR
jgi:hypothetical protein